MAVPRRRRWALWSEEWRATDVRLRGVEGRIRETGAVVLRGGDFDRWDLEVRAGLLGGARLRSMVEEHGSGRQLVRYAVTPDVSGTALLVVLAILGLAALAALDGAWLAAGVLAVVGVSLLTRLLLEAGRAVAALGAALDEPGLVPVRRAGT